MKKTFNRVLAAVMAVPLAMTQLLSVSVTAADSVNAMVTVRDFLDATPNENFPEDISGLDSFKFDQYSTWNEIIKSRVEENAGRAVTVDITPIIDTIASTNRFVGVVRNVLKAQPNATATIENSVITIKGKLEGGEAFENEWTKELEYLGLKGVKVDGEIANGVEYTILAHLDELGEKVVNLDWYFTVNNKEFQSGLVMNEDNYMTYVNAVAQYLIDQSETYNASPESLKKAQDRIEYLRELADIHVEKRSVNTQVRNFSNIDEMIAWAKEDAEKFGTVNTILGKTEIPASLDDWVDRFGSKYMTVIDTLNTSFEEQGIEIQLDITPDDIAQVLREGTDFELIGDAENQSYTVYFNVEENQNDPQYDKVYAYVEEQVAAQAPDKAVENVETYKEVKAYVDRTGKVSFDVVRHVTVDLKENATTTTTAETTTSTETTTTTGTETGTETQTETQTETGTGTETGTETQTQTQTETGTGTETGTETLPPPDQIDEIELVLDIESDQGVYFSHQQNYKAADMIKSVVASMKDGTTTELPLSAVKFLTTPEEDYNAKADYYGKKLFVGEVDVEYAGNTEDVKVNIKNKPVAAVAMKGDTNLDAVVDTEDAFLALDYFADHGSGQDTKFISNQDVYPAQYFEESAYAPLLEKLVFFITDINTISKAGENSTAGIIDTSDAAMQLTYFSIIGSGMTADWKSVIASVDGTNYVED